VSELREENRKLKGLVADLSLDKHLVRGPELNEITYQFEFGEPDDVF
jgi:hypothetical protein